MSHCSVLRPPPTSVGEFLLNLGSSRPARPALPSPTHAVRVGGGWIPRMIKKDRSLARYPEFSDYKRRTRMLVPFVV